MYQSGRRDEYLRKIEEIYNDFRNSLDSLDEETRNRISKYLFSDEISAGNKHIALEEFLVESLTSEELVNYLNSVDAEFEKKKLSNNLWQRILKVLSDIFGWEIRKGSLREKELYALQGQLKNIRQAIDNVGKQETKQEEKVDNKQEITAKTNEESKPKPRFRFGQKRDTRGSSITEAPKSDYTPEMQAIKEKTIADGTFMKAPNGKPTNLNERQWLQVRTKAFKDWFGDWEKAIIQNKYEPIASNPKFKHSLFRGQASVPEIDADGNLHLKTKYDSLSKLKTLSFASVKNEALHYGYRVAKNPYIIEVNEDYLDNILPKEEYEREKVESKKPFRYNEEFNEVRLSFNDEIIIPKGQYNVTHDDKTINITDLNSAIAEILSLNELRFKSDSQEYTGISELEGAVSSQDIKEYDDKIINILGEKYYNIIAVSELSKDQRLQHYIPVNYNTIRNYINEGYLIEKDYDSFTEKELKTLPSEAIEQIKKELSYYELTDKAKKEIDNAIKSNKTEDNVSKVVDENGEPLVVYHRSPNKFNKFDVNKIGSTTDSGQYGKGFYFGKEKDRADGNNIYAVFLNIRNPYNITKESRNSNIAYTYNRPFNEWTDWHKKHISKEENNLVNSKDGIIDLVEDNEFVVTDPNQVKSATSNIGEFSTTNDDIRFSSVTEQPNRQQSVQAFTERLPIEEQAQFMRSVAHGDISTACR